MRKNDAVEVKEVVFLKERKGMTQGERSNILRKTEEKTNTGH